MHKGARAVQKNVLRNWNKCNILPTPTPVLILILTLTVSLNIQQKHSHSTVLSATQRPVCQSACAHSMSVNFLRERALSKFPFWFGLSRKEGNTGKLPTFAFELRPAKGHKRVGATCDQVLLL